ncbi:hypothetical protein COO60DRAFT_8258 [Scenedesmus sp. NREL 46B-D3]|nr:hypothetical protein COO60DRAFT_8258 [Scenedesmus sp. NREL 46B-D3]
MQAECMQCRPYNSGLQPPRIRPCAKHAKHMHCLQLHPCHHTAHLHHCLRCPLRGCRRLHQLLPPSCCSALESRRQLWVAGYVVQPALLRVAEHLIGSDQPKEGLTIGCSEAGLQVRVQILGPLQGRHDGRCCSELMQCSASMYCASSAR